VVALTEVTDFHRRLRATTSSVSLHKGPGHGAKLYPRWALLRRAAARGRAHAQPGPLEMQVAAAWCRVAGACTASTAAT
jgi:hypothetical protein